jgi:hypothetical protein
MKRFVLIVTFTALSAAAFGQCTNGDCSAGGMTLTQLGQTCQEPTVPHVLTIYPAGGTATYSDFVADANGNVVWSSPSSVTVPEIVNSTSPPERRPMLLLQQ